MIKVRHTRERSFSWSWQCESCINDIRSGAADQFTIASGFATTASDAADCGRYHLRNYHGIFVGKYQARS